MTPFWLDWVLLRVADWAGAHDPRTQPRGLGEAALWIAQAERGNGEEGRNNAGVHVERYRAGKVEEGPWCAAFVQYCFEVAAARRGTPLAWKRTHGAKALFRRIAAAGVLVKVEEAKPGDVVCWHRGPPGSWQGHIGFVEGLKGGILSCIEGNSGAYPAKVRSVAHDIKYDTRRLGIARV